MVVLLGEVVADFVIWHERAPSRRYVLFCISEIDDFIFAFVSNVLMEAIDCTSPVGLNLVVHLHQALVLGWMPWRGMGKAGSTGKEYGSLHSRARIVREQPPTRCDVM